jgi:ribonuclease P protein component
MTFVARKMTDERFGKSVRLRRQAQFDRVYDSDSFAADDVLVVRGCRNGLDYSRLGVSVSRKVGGAVVRNRWKRLMREAFRLSRAAIPVGLDLVVRPRRGAQPEFGAIRGSLARLSGRIAQRLGKGRA